MSEEPVVLQAGDRVVLRGHPAFADGVTGTVTAPYEFLLEDRLGFWIDCRLLIQGRTRSIVFYYITFDERHDDGTGDGPYSGAEIDDAYLERL